MTHVAPAGTRYTVSVLTTDTVDSAPSLLVTFDAQRYLFNAPEAVSRVALSNKVGLRKVGHVFLGDLAQSAGLPGLILSSVEGGNDKMVVHGPRGTDHFVASCRFFTRRDRLSLKVNSVPTISKDDAARRTLPEPVHADANLIVYGFPLTPSASLSPTTAPHDSAVKSNGEDGSESLKRRRSSLSVSPPPPAKSPRRTSPRRGPSPLFDPAAENFNPARLQGANAARWRYLVVRDMFRGTAFEPAPDPLPTTTPSGRHVPGPAYRQKSLPPLSRTFKPATPTYLVVGPKLRGKFQPEKAIALGVPPGRAFARLVAGETVWARATPVDELVMPPGKIETKKEKKARLKKAANVRAKLAEGEGEGRWVTPEECVEPGVDGAAFLVVNLPSPAYLSSLADVLDPSLFERESLGGGAILRGVFFFLGPDVLAHSAFHSYVSALRQRFPDIDMHVSSADFVKHGKNEVVYGPSALLNLRLRQVDEDMFRLPHYSFLTPDALASLPNLPSGLTPLVSNSHFSSAIVPAQEGKPPFGDAVLRNFDFHVPSPESDAEAARLKGFDSPEETLAKAAAAWENFMAKAKEARRVVAAEEARHSYRPIDSSVPVSEGSLVVTALGTGSAVPSKYRNVSGTLLHIPPAADCGRTQYILFDGGEGTWGQIARRFGNGDSSRGEDSKEDVLRNLQVIFLSHMHQDHHAGVSMILQQRAKLDPPPETPLTIVGPSSAIIYLREQDQLFDLGLEWEGSIRFIDNYSVEPGRVPYESSQAENAVDDLKTRLGLTVTAVPVKHRCRAWGAVVTHDSGWRAVFSGDTMPCDALVEAGQGASLLVHEATIEDDMPEVAEAKGHSTFGQAIDVATRMRARHLLLTHFSARYPKLPPPSAFATDGEAHRPIVANAFDLMSLRLADFWKVERYRDAMDALLSWDEAGDRDDADELSGKDLAADGGD
ncbi:3' tRNA processing endoribonuclease [Rhodotorula toruloides]|uniref:ribonuclease Z n=1 Tax=Rhodotorula toruloides TaxID=5286 RepID=A0A511KMU5_RHOTO|nr:3' tRNA processing endoribonuclease [Rhodotorula toruloides]